MKQKKLKDVYLIETREDLKRALVHIKLTIAEFKKEHKSTEHLNRVKFYIEQSIEFLNKNKEEIREFQESQHRAEHGVF